MHSQDSPCRAAPRRHTKALSHAREILKLNARLTLALRSARPRARARLRACYASRPARRLRGSAT
eukprot:1653082-Prymnesium_polylepis.1